MARKIIGPSWERNELNNHNSNYEELYRAKDDAMEVAENSKKEIDEALEGIDEFKKEIKVKVEDSDEKSSNAEKIAEDTNERMNQIISGETDSAEIIDARKPIGEEASATLGERLNSQIGRTGLFRDFEKPLVEKMMNAFFEREVNIKDFGAKCDGVTVDDVAINSAIEAIKNMGGGTLYFPEGITIVDFVIKVEDVPIKIKGASRFLSTIKAKDQSKMFHNPTRDLTSNKNVGLDSLYRDYHAIFFFRNCHVEFENIDLFGNPENNFEVIDGKKFNFYGESIHSHLGVKGYKYFHGVVTLYDNGAKRIFKAKDCSFRQFSWNDVLINNNGVQTDVEIDVKNCFFDGSAQDGISVHKVKSQSDIRNNIFRNCNTHATHIYFDAWDVNVDFNHYIYDDDNYFNFYPNVKNGVRKHCIQIGHGSYVNNLLKNIKVRGNTLKELPENLSYEVCGLFLGKTIDGLIVEKNDFKTADYSMMVYPIILGECIFAENKGNFKTAGIMFYLDTLLESDLHPDYSKPYNSKIRLERNELISNTNPRNSLRVIAPTGVTKDIVRMSIFCDGNKFSGATVTPVDFIEFVDNNYSNENLLKIKYDLVADKANGFRGRNSTNQYTNYQMVTPTVTDLNSKNVILNGFLINSTKNPDVSFDNVTYFEDIRLGSGKYAFKLFIKNDESISLRAELRRVNGTLIKTIVPEETISASSGYVVKVFYFSIDDLTPANDQIISFVFNATGSSKKLVNLGVVGLKLERLQEDFKFATINNFEKSTYPEMSYSINTVPLRAGLMTTVGRNVYVSVGNLNTSDWVKITNN